MNLTYKPNRLIFIVALVLLAASLLPVRNTIDLHFHDTYYVMNHFIFCLICSFFLLIIGITCEMTNRFLYSNSLSRLHIVLTITAILVFIIPVYFHNHFLTHIMKQRNDMSLFEQAMKTGQIISISILVLLSAQLLLVANVIAGLLKKEPASG